MDVRALPLSTAEIIRRMTPGQRLDLQNDMDLISRDHWAIEKSYDATGYRVHLAEMRTKAGAMKFCLWVEFVA